MLILPNYQISTQIYESTNSLIYRGIKLDDNQAVVLKVLKEDYPTPEELTRYRQEYDIMRLLASVEGVIKVYDLEKYQNTLVIILEDFEAKSLKTWQAQRTFTLNELLQFAIQITNILGQIHEQHIIHKDINPSNILLNSNTGVLKIIDFGISTQLSKQYLTLKNPAVLEGTLAYMSPEQTGRMNRALDYQTDFYSLGATFYELFTGKVAFESQDAMELVHCHIAKQPIPPHQVNPDLPRVISQIILKLLEKTAEARYQSAWGIKADIEKCQLQLTQTGQIENFILAQQDISDRFQIPQKLYGRESEIETLLTAFENIIKGPTEIMLIVGYSGIGKSILVKEIYQSLSEKQGYFISGKFDQFQRNIPYSAIVSAFKELVQQLLTENETLLSVWKEKLLTALEPNGQVIIDILPELEWIIGKQPPVPSLGPTESQNRFNLVFQDFMQVFCQPKHPLVVFLDDLQWVDSATLKLLELIMTNRENMTVFLIGAYRENEVEPTHPLMTTLEKFRKKNVTIRQITLKPLVFEHINQLIAESLHHNRETVSSLTHLVMRKTGGNPFFVNQFLHTLYEEDLLHFVLPKGEQKAHWQWDIAQIEAINMTDNVVDLMIGKLKKLPESAQQVLRLAACVGHHFDLATLSVIYEKSLFDTFQDLMLVLTEEFVLPASELQMVFEDDTQHSKFTLQKFRFSHDRIQQASYSLINENQKKILHLQIGRLLLKNTPTDELDKRIFDIVEQLNQGIELLEAQAEQTTMARLNLIAGQKAKLATAYEVATKYLTIGQQCLTANSWQTDYDLTFNLYLEAIEAEYISGNQEQATQLSDIALQNAKTALEQSKIYLIQVKFYSTQVHKQTAINISLKALEILNVPLQDSPPQKLSIDKLYALPTMTHPDKLAAFHFLISVYAPVITTKPALIPSIVFTMVHLCVNHGNSPLAAFGYIAYAAILCVTGKIESAYQFGQLALALQEQFDAKAIRCKVHHFYNALIKHWKEPVGNTIEALSNNIQVGLIHGDFEFAGYSVLDYCSNIFLTGEYLTTVQQEHQQYINLLHKHKQEYSLNYAKVWGQVALNLSVETEDKCCLNGQLFNETERVPVLQAANNLTPLFCVYLGKTMLNYWFRNYQAAIDNAEQSVNYEQSMVTLLPIGQQPFYHSLALLGLYPRVTPQKQTIFLEKVAANQQKMFNWVEHAPMNYQHKYILVEAEKARVLGQLEAIDLYEQAIKGAKNHGYLQEEALAYELAADFYLGRAMEEIAELYLTKAFYAYQQWGAKVKLEDLKVRYPQFLSIKTVPTIPTDVTISAARIASNSTTSSSKWLDLTSLMKAAQTLSSEIVLSHLLEKMMHIVIENAGAETGFLLLPQNENWLIEAWGQVDNEEVKVLQSTSLENQPIAQTIIQYVNRTQENVVLHDATQENQFTRDPHIIKQCPKSVLCTPLMNQGQLTGILYLENNLITGAFTSKHLEMLKVLSSQLAISIENALLYQTLEQKVEERTAQLAEANAQLANTNTQLTNANEEISTLNEQLKSENLRMSAELNVSRQLQQILLPKEKELEQIDRLDIAGFMEPAEEVGGDYYDVLQDSGRILFAIGDVTGHGLESGALAIMVQSSIRTLLANNETDPVRFFSALNTMVYHNVQRMNMNKNLTLALIDYFDNQLYLSGQHEEMIVVRQGKLELIETMDLGFPVGLEKNIADLVHQVTVPLNVGDVVVLYTDGITEAENIDRQMYELERLCEVVRQHWQKTAHEIQQAVIEDVRQFIGQQKVFDDITLLVFKQK